MTTVLLRVVSTHKRMYPRKWPDCPECGDNHTFPRNPYTDLYTCEDCGMIFEFDEETGDTEKIKFDIVYDREKHIELIQERIKQGDTVEL